MFSGIPAEDAIGKPYQIYSGHPRNNPSGSNLQKRSYRTDRQEHLKRKYSRREQKRVLEINAYPSARGVSVVARDITERKLDETLMQKRFELMEYSAHHSLEELMQRTIDEVSELTDSHIGFLHFVEEDQETLNCRHGLLKPSKEWERSKRRKCIILWNLPGSGQMQSARAAGHP